MEEEFSFLCLFPHLVTYHLVALDVLPLLLGDITVVGRRIGGRSHRILPLLRQPVLVDIVPRSFDLTFVRSVVLDSRNERLKFGRTGAPGHSG